MADNSINVTQSIQEVERLLAQSDELPPALEAAIHMLLTVVKLLADRVGLDSHKSSKAPASDPNRRKKSQAKQTRPRGGQPGHRGRTLQPVEDPDLIESIEIDHRSLPRGDYVERGYVSRQQVDIHIRRHVTENRAQVLENEQGERFVAPSRQG